MKRHTGFLILLATLLFTPQVWAKDSLLFVALAPGGDGTFRSYFTDFKSLVEENYAGGIDVKLMIDGEAGTEETMTATVRRGRAQFASLTAAGVSSAIPEMTLLMAPYLFDSYEESDFILDNYVSGLVRELFAEKGLRFLSWEASGWWLVFSSKPIQSPADARDVRLRAANGDAAQLFMKAIDADVIPLPFSDIIPSLQTGLINGGATNAPMYATMGIYEHAPYLLLTRHAINPAVVMANAKWFDRLSPENQELLATAFGPTDVHREGVRQEAEDSLALARSANAVLHELSPAERQAWITATKPTHAQLIDRIGGRAQELYDLMMDGKAAFAAQQSAAE